MRLVAAQRGQSGRESVFTVITSYSIHYTKLYELGSGCGSKTLIRIGGGSLKSLVVFVFLGIAAYMTLRGLFGAFRVDVLA